MIGRSLNIGGDDRSTIPQTPHRKVNVVQHGALQSAQTSNTIKIAPHPTAIAKKRGAKGIDFHAAIRTILR